MKMMLILLVCFAASGCAWQEYDKNNPDAYHKYWCDPTNQHAGVLSLLSPGNVVDDSLGFPQVDPQLARQQCIDNYLQQKYNETINRGIEKGQERT
jgi:hypothetical protein